MDKSQAEQFLQNENAKTIVDLIADPDTPETLRIKLIRKILDSNHSDNFFKTIFDEKMSYGECPNCQHKSHWLVPEVELNQMGWVSHDIDPRIPKFTNTKDCKKWEQACKKKKIFI